MSYPEDLDKYRFQRNVLLVLFVLAVSALAGGVAAGWFIAEPHGRTEKTVMDRSIDACIAQFGVPLFSGYRNNGDMTDCKFRSQ